MGASKSSFSLIDIAPSYQSGPVLSERTPNINRAKDHYNSESADESQPTELGKKLTRTNRASRLKKKALGLTDIPIHSTPGNNAQFRERDKYDDEDFEAQFTTAFGGPSIIDGVEDKHPTNKSNDGAAGETEEIAKMSFIKNELLKLSRSLSHTGNYKYSNIILKLAQDEITLDEARLFEEVWVETDASSDLQEARNDVNKAFFASLYSRLGFALGTREGLMLASLLHGPNVNKVHRFLKKSWQVQSDSTIADIGMMVLQFLGWNLGARVLGTLLGGVGGFIGAKTKKVGEWLGWAAGGVAGTTLVNVGVRDILEKALGATSYEDASIEQMVRSELSGKELKAAELILNGKVTLLNFNPASGKFINMPSLQDGASMTGVPSTTGVPQAAPAEPTAPAKEPAEQGTIGKSDIDYGVSDLSTNNEWYIAESDNGKDHKIGVKRLSDSEIDGDELYSKQARGDIKIIAIYKDENEYNSFIGVDIDRAQNRPKFLTRREQALIMDEIRRDLRLTRRDIRAYRRIISGDRIEETARTRSGRRRGRRRSGEE